MAMRIFDYLEYLEFNTTEELFQQILHSEEADEDINSILTNILLINEEFRPSDEWEKFRHIEVLNEELLIQQAIRSIILNNLEEEIRLAIERIEEEPDNESLIVNYRDLIKQREVMYEKEV